MKFRVLCLLCCMCLSFGFSVYAEDETEEFMTEEVFIGDGYSRDWNPDMKLDIDELIQPVYSDGKRLVPDEEHNVLTLYDGLSVMAFDAEGYLLFTNMDGEFIPRNDEVVVEQCVYSEPDVLSVLVPSGMCSLTLIDEGRLNAQLVTPHGRVHVDTDCEMVDLIGDNRMKQVGVAHEPFDSRMHYRAWLVSGKDNAFVYGNLTEDVTDQIVVSMSSGAFHYEKTGTNVAILNGKPVIADSSLPADELEEFPQDDFGSFADEPETEAESSAEPVSDETEADLRSVMPDTVNSAKVITSEGFALSPSQEYDIMTFHGRDCWVLDERDNVLFVVKDGAFYPMGDWFVKESMSFTTNSTARIRVPHGREYHVCVPDGCSISARLDTVSGFVDVKTASGSVVMSENSVSAEPASLDGFAYEVAFASGTDAGFAAGTNEQGLDAGETAQEPLTFVFENGRVVTDP